MILVERYRTFLGVVKRPSATKAELEPTLLVDHIWQYVGPIVVCVRVCVRVCMCVFVEIVYLYHDGQRTGVDEYRDISTNQPQVQRPHLLLFTPTSPSSTHMLFSKRYSKDTLRIAGCVVDHTPL